MRLCGVNLTTVIQNREIPGSPRDKRILLLQNCSWNKGQNYQKPHMGSNFIKIWNKPSFKTVLEVCQTFKQSDLFIQEDIEVSA